jgi:hypothetical protein
MRVQETLPCIPLGQLFRPRAFRSDITDIVKAAFPLFWGCAGRNGWVGVGGADREAGGGLVGADLCLQWSGGIQSASGCDGTGSRSWTENGQRVATEPHRARRRGYLAVMS